MQATPVRQSTLVLVCGAILAASDTALANSLDPCESAVLTLAETADVLRVDANDLERISEAREIPARRIGDEWRFSCAAVMAWLSGDVSSAAIAAAADPVRRLDHSELRAIAGAGAAAAQGARAEREAGRNSNDLAEEPIGEAPEQATAEDILLRDQRILVNPREVSLNFGQFYSETDGLVFTADESGTTMAVLEQTALLTTFQARFGVSNRTEAFIGTTYIDQDSDIFLGSRKLGSAGYSEFGDVLFGARRTLMREAIGRPNIIGTLTAQIPTGESSYAIGGGLGFVKSLDPVALFATASYTYTFSEDFADIARLEPKHRLDTSLGFALALNDRLSLSGAVSGVFTGATSFPNARLRQQDRYSLGFGLTSRISEGLYLEPTVGLALGGTTDGYAFGLSLFSLGR